MHWFNVNAVLEFVREPLTTQDRRKPAKKDTTMRQRCCWLCHGNHLLQHCKIFGTWDFYRRRQLTNEKFLCDNCLRRGHRSAQCGEPYMCTIKDCNLWKHTTLLHPPSTFVETFFNQKKKTGRQIQRDNALSKYLWGVIWLQVNNMIDTGLTTLCSSFELNMWTIDNDSTDSDQHKDHDEHIKQRIGIGKGIVWR